MIACTKRQQLDFVLAEDETADDAAADPVDGQPRYTKSGLLLDVPGLSRSLPPPRPDAQSQSPRPRPLNATVVASRPETPACRRALRLPPISHDSKADDLLLAECWELAAGLAVVGREGRLEPMKARNPAI